MKIKIKAKIKNSGFIALMSAILISAVLLALLITANFSSLYARFDVEDTQSRHSAFALAEACAQEALLRLAQNYQYDPTSAVAVAVGGAPCYIESITPHAPRAGTSTPVTIEAWGTEAGTFSNLSVNAVVLNPAVSSSAVPLPPPITVTSWHEWQ